MSNIPDGWRFVGRYSEGPCQGCHYVFQTTHMPAFGDAFCSGCRAINGAKDLVLQIESMRTERGRLWLELETAYKRIAELEDELHARSCA